MDRFPISYLMRSGPPLAQRMLLKGESYGSRQTTRIVLVQAIRDLVSHFVRPQSLTSAVSWQWRGPFLQAQSGPSYVPAARSLMEFVPSSQGLAAAFQPLPIRQYPKMLMPG